MATGVPDAKDPKWYVEQFEAFQKAGPPTGTNPHWLPLESNPDVLNRFSHQGGLSPDWQWCDVFGLDEELLGMVPSPCAAVCLLYPSKNISRERRTRYRMAAAEGTLPAVSPPPFYLWQIANFGNACGSIAAVHAVANGYLQGTLSLNDGTLKKFIDENRTEGPGALGLKLADASRIHEASEASAEGGQTATPDRRDHLDNHFIALVPHGGRLVELDGCMGFPLDHGPTTAASFVTDAAKVIREQFIALDPTNPRFCILALCKV